MIKINGRMYEDATLFVEESRATLKFTSDETLAQIEEEFQRDDTIVEKYSSEGVLISKYYSKGVISIGHEKQEDVEGKEDTWRFTIIFGAVTLDIDTATSLREGIDNNDEAMIELADSVARYEQIVEDCQKNVSQLNIDIERRMLDQDARINNLHQEVVHTSELLNRVMDRIATLENAH